MVSACVGHWSIASGTPSWSLSLCEAAATAGGITAGGGAGSGRAGEGAGVGGAPLERGEDAGFEFERHEGFA
ncbi:MAG TPA: hypothetical protein PLR99_20105, partial [Polyangiaceae bacterium]|nr:hypothetical protein [Polyangiaceae bacterium]